MTKHTQTQFVEFRIFSMPCCHRQICWVGPRLPNNCPECGVKCFLKLKFEPEHTLFTDKTAKLVHAVVTT